ncbi:MAG: riboflavin synthase [Alphaproteobacteria bacterium]
MFTGLIQDIGVIRSVEGGDGGVRFEVETKMNLDDTPLGASICCSGCCLTVVEKSKNTFYVDVSQETLSRTNLGAWQVMTRVNLEPSLKVGDELGGHIVSGHVDAVTKIETIEADGNSYRIRILIPEGLAPFIAEKGSVSLDGISLTVNDVTKVDFGVNIIPHTWQETTLSDRQSGDHINIEIDMLARYVARMVECKNDPE